MAIATGTAILLAGLGAAGGSAASAAVSSRATGKAAQLQTQSANYAADKQAEATREALEFQKAEAARNQAIAESTRRANYDQWAAEQRRRGTLGQLLGLGAPEIPAYVPIEGSLGAAAGGPDVSHGTSAGAPTGPPSGDYQAWFNSLIAGKPFNQQTLLDLEPTLNAAGVKLTPPNAAGDRTKIQLPTGQWVRVGFGEGKPVWVVQPGTGSVSPMGQMGQIGTPGTLGAAMPWASAPLTPALQVPPWQQGTLGQMWMG